MRSIITAIAISSIFVPATFADSLFNNATANAGTMVSVKKAKFTIGDIITVNVQETIDASTNSNTNTKKESEVESTASVSSNPFLTTKKPNGPLGIKSGFLPNWSIESENEQKSRGNTKRTNKLTMTVSCTVTKVFENGNIAIMGTKTVTVNREDSQIMVSGVVRPRDVTTANTINSSQIANATIELKGKGPLWNNQRRGLFTKLLDWFSPF